MFLNFSSYLHIFAANHFLRNVSINIKYKYTIKCLSNNSKLTFEEIPNTIIGCSESIALNLSCQLNYAPFNIANIGLFDSLKAEIKDKLFDNTQIKDISVLHNDDLKARFHCEELSTRLDYKYQLIAIDMQLELNNDISENEENCCISRSLNNNDIPIHSIFKQIFMKSLSNWRITFPIIFNKLKYRKLVSMQNSLSTIEKTIEKFANISENINNQLKLLNGNEALLDMLNAIVINCNNNGSALEYDILNLSTENINENKKTGDIRIQQNQNEEDFFSNSSDDSIFLLDC